MNCKNCGYKYCAFRGADREIPAYLCEDFEAAKKDGESWVEKRFPRMTPYERTRAAVYATGNRWAIENFHATHD